MVDGNAKEKATFLKIFLIFAKIGAFTIGGGYAMIPLIQNEMVRRGWLEEKEFPDLIALSQTAPGILAVNISIFVGYKLRGTKGSIVATLGSILPSFLIILIIAIAFTGYQDNPVVVRIFKGIRPVVVALIAAPMVKMAMTNNRKWWHWLIMLSALAMTAFLGISPIYIMLCVIVLAAAVTIYNDKRYMTNISVQLDPLDLDTAAFIIANPLCLRRLWFAALEAYTEQSSCGGYGRPSEYDSKDIFDSGLSGFYFVSSLHGCYHEVNYRTVESAKTHVLSMIEKFKESAEQVILG